LPVGYHFPFPEEQNYVWQIFGQLKIFPQKNKRKSNRNFLPRTSIQSIHFCVLDYSPESTQMSIIRCPSMSQKLGSELSNSCGSLLGTRRPRSCNGSSESLPIFYPHTTATKNSHNKQVHYHCPSGEQCDEVKLTEIELIQHVNTIHHAPTIFFGSSSAEISLPPRLPIENASLILQLDGKQFWVKVVANAA
jgi:hypothetical protein